MKESAALYVHLPFCRSKCHYCGYFSVTNQWHLAEVYAKAVIAELRFYRVQFPDLKLTSIFIGGGTPSAFPLAELVRIFYEIRDLFHVKPGLEWTVEMNPDSVTDAVLRLCQEVGVNRISMGVQSMRDDDLHFLGRIHDVAAARQAVTQIHEAGFANLNLDMIYGFRDADMAEELQRLLALMPSHVSLYTLMIDPGSRFYRRGVQPMDGDRVAGMYDQVRRWLRKAGYSHYEVSAFARPGFQCQHNLNYWHYGPYIGIGAGGQSYFRNRRYGHSRFISGYIQNPIPARMDSGRATPEKIRRKEWLVMHFRLRTGFFVSEYNQLFGRDFDREFEAVLPSLCIAGLVSRSGNRIRVTVRGLGVLDSIISEFM